MNKNLLLIKIGKRNNSYVLKLAHDTIIFFNNAIIIRVGLVAKNNIIIIIIINVQ
jgi:hypothetical protein